MDTVKIHITGIVQGVGFRPFVYNLANRFGLKGYCLNDSEGVVIEVQGDTIPGFIDELKASAPPLSKIESLTVERATAAPFENFSIKESKAIEGKSVLISPDIGICKDCLTELFNPEDRRYLYPFINCTNCGPRYSIVKDIPYDRPKTTMAPFPMCPDCDSEYHDPSDRRFHAQPNACEVCGPKVWIHGQDRESHEAIKEAQRLLKSGAILAVKGIGGFHLACDAENEEAVKRLREKKRRSIRSDRNGSNKPFAVMSPDIEAIKRYTEVSRMEEGLLLDRTRPIVLLKKIEGKGLAGTVAPNNTHYGVMLPYAPLHYVLFHGADFKALVMTSGNLSEEPIVISNEDALKRLSGIAEHFLFHDREIYMRVDDSIVRAEDVRTRILRRARGFTPSPIALNTEMDEILACGAELKNTFCLTKGRNAILSQHIGDLENYEALEFYKETLRNLKNSFRAEPKIIAHDLHPDYLSTKFAHEYANEKGIPEKDIYAVQHHHAHIAAVMAEHGLNDKVIGVAFDGSGYGTDGNIWGGEFLISDKRDFKRAARLDYISLPGGERAIKEPWRIALSYLYHTYGDGVEAEAKTFFERCEKKEANIVLKMIKGSINSPLTSSAGRLFDAVSSLIGVRDFITFEAEAAIELEAIADTDAKEAKKLYQFEMIENECHVINLKPLIKGILKDLKNGISKSVISGRFHKTMAEVITTVVNMLNKESGIKDVALSGGVFQNKLLSRLTEERLKNDGFTVWTPEMVPVNDGGVSLGQAIVAWERHKGEK